MTHKCPSCDYNSPRLYNVKRHIAKMHATNTTSHASDEQPESEESAYEFVPYGSSDGYYNIVHPFIFKISQPETHVMYIVPSFFLRHLIEKEVERFEKEKDVKSIMKLLEENPAGTIRTSDGKDIKDVKNILVE